MTAKFTPWAPHKELLANDTIYQEIYASQMKGDDADGKGIQR